MKETPRFYFDFTKQSACNSYVNNGNITFERNTSIQYDEKEQALCVSAREKTDITLSTHTYSGCVLFYAPKDVETMEDCPYFVLKIKLSHKSIGFGGAVARVNAKPSWVGDPDWETYQPTEDWQLFYIRVDKTQHCLYTGNWLGALLFLSSCGTEFEAGEPIAWIQWSGVFPSLEKAYAFAEMKLPAKHEVSTLENKFIPVQKDLPMFPIKETLPIAEAAARVNRNLSKPLKKIPSEYALVHDFDPVFSFVHHGGLAVFKGRLYASHSRAIKDEDAPAQQVVVRSMPLNDFGNWSEPLFVGMPVLASDGIHLTSYLAGYLHTDGDTLYFNFAKKEYAATSWDQDGRYINAEHASISWINMVSSTTDGINWTEPVPAGASANESPRQSLTGHWFCGSGNSLLYSEEERPGTDWSFVGPTKQQLQEAFIRGSVDLPESSWYQTDDYVIHHMLRSNSKTFWMCNSYDNGKTWTDIYPTNFVAAATMPHFGRLPDGRYYFVGSAADTNIRFPLHLYVSKDGYNFDTGYILRDEPYNQQRSGYAKGGPYAYPEVLFAGEYMYVLYSKQKEVMEISRVKLSDI